LRTAFDWLIPFATGEKKWEYQQISKYNKTDIYPLLLQAADKFKDDHYLNYSNEINKEDNDLLTALLYRN
jgi:hypothetical protein